MGIIGGKFGYYFLMKIARNGKPCSRDEDTYLHKSKMEALLGIDIWQKIKGKTVIDFGCGCGTESVEMAQQGAKTVIGIDIQDKLLKKARKYATLSGVDGRCTFVTRWDKQADAIIAIDSFEHFDNPALVLHDMHRLLKPDGQVLIAFGPPWYHPLGGHLFSVFPWAHLLFTEKCLMRWRSNFRNDGATRFNEVDGGLNQMTIRKFEDIIANSRFNFSHFETVPIKSLATVAVRANREFTTSVVRCTLVHRS